MEQPITEEPTVEGRNVHKRTLAQREQDLELIGQLSLKGLGDQEIADHLAQIRPYAISRRQVTFDLAEVRARGRKRHLGRLADLLAIEIERLNEEEREAYAAWERSKLPREIVRQTKSKNGDVKTTIIKRTSAGDPRHLWTLLKLREQRIKLLGLARPLPPQPQRPLGEDPERVRRTYREVIEARVRAEMMAGKPNGNGVV